MINAPMTGLCTTPDRGKVKPFTDLRQWPNFPSVPPHCSKRIALQRKVADWGVDKDFPVV
jgi:hypothetical protein